MQHELAGKVAVITGGGRGIGAAIATRLAGMGATTVISGRDLKQLQRTAGEIAAKHGNCEPMVCDVTDFKAVESFAAAVVKKLNRVDILVNNAGIGGFGGPLHKLPPTDWDAILNTNLRGVFYCMRAFAPAMIERRSGEIVNMSSIASKNALPNGAAYAASKWGLNGLSYSAAEELRGYDIRVSVICPGSTDTELSPHTGKNANKMLKPGDVAHVVAMLVTQAPQSFASEIVLRPTQKP